MMSDQDYEVFNPTGAPLSKLSAKERVEIEMAQAWAYYINGGGGMPWVLCSPFWTLEAYSRDRGR